MHALAHELRLFLVALQFLTRVPVRFARWQDDWLQACARHFAGVGLLVGGFAALVLWGTAHFFGALLAVLLSVVATVWLTGAFHEDGLADTFDGLGGSADRGRALAIMKDSRLGTYGTLALVAVLALKVAALHALAVRDLLAALALLPLVHAVSRAAAVVLLAALPYAGDAEHARAKPLVQRADGLVLVVTAGWVLIAVAAAAPFVPADALLAAAVAAPLALMAMRRWLRRRLGGFTGDTLGATQQLVELAMLLAALAALSR
ncbi:MAG: adenosylcobinamide-GDP ribazoletransferase [Burkholderiaceae bacterium]|jgi:adenosylcobinamide-GDP ribazoletransferase|nr:adenosylcobinamide-GDP ribazoletransferase [Burkholderiaceae bacterium]MCZ8175338.1 adenosylcobinamide-GDP ribazoletransferase [Burkholderiaceae bacterium]